MSREDIILGANITFETMARLRLNIHIGTKDKASKTEAVYFPSRTKIIDWLKENDKNYSLALKILRWCPILVKKLGKER